MKKCSLDNAVIVNPKQQVRASSKASERLFPYYAGYSMVFVEQLLGSLALESDTLILDPWNGSGTTVKVANQFGLNSIGVDLNPVMVIAAKASLISHKEANSLLPLAQSLIEQALIRKDEGISDDPLSEWFIPESARYFRQIEVEINRTLVSFDHYEPLTNNLQLNQLSALGAFFLCCIV